MNITPFFDTLLTPLGQIYIAFVINKDDPYSIYLKEIVFSREDFSVPINNGILQQKMKRLSSLRRQQLPEKIKEQFYEYFKGMRMDFEVPFLLSGSGFSKGVLLTLQKIPYGETRTYRWLAERVGSPRSARAVGQVLKRNPLPILLPCHRVIQSNGKLGGFLLGVEVKRRLLEFERCNI